MGKGIVMSIMSALGFSMVNAIVKYLSLSFHTGEIAFFRGLFSAILIIALIRIQHVRLSHKDIPTLVARGVLGGCGMICLFFALAGMPIGDVSILSQLSAFFVIVFAAIFLHDILPKGAIPPLSIIVIGACLILHPWNYTSFNGSAMFALAQAVFSAAAYTTISKLANSGEHHQYEIVLYFLVCATIAGAVIMGTDFIMPDAFQWGLFIIMGILTLLAQIWMTNAYTVADPIIVSFVQYIGVFFNVVWGYLFFDESMALLSIAGGICIIGGSMYLSKLKHDFLANMREVKVRQ
jgi:drug/metabolite transporter (DMT)-like permease